jgi:hypothetical protein
MQAIQLTTTGDRFLISIDKNLIDKHVLLQILESVHLETLAKIVAFDDGIESLGEEIVDKRRRIAGRFNEKGVSPFF